jgi:hypothetical protein
VAVLDILGRHIDLSDNEEYQDRENFLREQLNIPSQWIFEAKATLASACNRLVNKFADFTYGSLKEITIFGSLFCLLCFLRI